jgi:crotonobetainyl-CoA:carnitine CoA-transferase CaiB-like acyl-CoA transferase
MKRLPLNGLRILEMGHAWAGPHCCQLLGDLGAQVIKVEPPAGDMVRGGRNASRESGTFIPSSDDEKLWNKAGVFNQINRGKLGLGLNLETSEGKTLLAELVKISDMVIYNLTVGAMKKLGLGYEDLKAIKPDIILVSLNAYGLSGPWAGYRTYGVVLEPMCGFFSLTGYTDDSAPMRSGVDHIDPLSGTHAAGAALAALHYRQKTGKGQHINLSFLESTTNAIGPELLDYTVNARVRGHVGNRHGTMAPHGCYRCKGDDQWVAIAVGSDAEWRHFRDAMGNPSWAEGGNFDKLQDRLSRLDELDVLVEKWTMTMDKHEVMRRLQARGVAAGAVQDMREILNDSHLRKRNFFHTVNRDDIGDLEVVGTRAKLSKTPACVSGPAPKYGEHYRYVLGELLGKSDKEIENLIEKDVILLEPR